MKKFKVLILGAALILLGVIYLNRDTWRLYKDQMATKSRNDERMRAAETERAELIRRRAELSSPVGQERLARKQGYRKPGEQPLELHP